MRFLKNKIARAQEAESALLQEDDFIPDDNDNSEPEQDDLEWIPEPRKTRKETNSPRKTTKQARLFSCDNIIKNYGRGMTCFALSSMAKPYLKDITEKHAVKLVSFLRFVRTRKKSLNCIRKLREMLPIQADVDRPDFRYRLCFQELSIIFLKFFFVNWLFNSKIDGKIIHLSFRFKMLRRVRDPDHFTYLKEFNYPK